MVNSCVAAGCNNTCKHGVSLLTFPKNSQLRKKWINQVKTGGTLLSIQGFAASTLMIAF